VTIVVDASVLVAALIDSTATGAWATALLRSDSLAAPGHVHAEAANVLRRSALASQISHDIASWAHADLTKLRLDLTHYEPLSARIWELRSSVTVYDAWYVALAEALDVPLATLDRRLANAPGPRCTFLTPED